MPTPNLPPFRLPQVPSSPQNAQQSGGGNFLSLLMMVCIFLIIMRLFSSSTKQNDELVNVESDNQTQTELPVTLPNADTVKANLPKELKQAVENVTPEFITLGSMDSKDPYRMLITLSNRGASVARIELNEKSYRDTHDMTGYLGQFVVDETLIKEEIRLGLPGVPIQVVGQGTPIQRAALKVGDRIVSFEVQGEGHSEGHSVEITSFDVLREELLKTRPGQTIQLGVLKSSAFMSDKATAEKVTQLKSRAAQASLIGEQASLIGEQTSLIGEQASTGTEAGKKTSTSEKMENPITIAPEIVSVELQRAPVAIVRPEGFLKTYNDYTNLTGLQGASYRSDAAVELAEDYSSTVRKENSVPLSFLMTLGSYDQKEKLNWFPSNLGKKNIENAPMAKMINQELAEVGLRNGFWQYVAEKSNENTAVFRKVLPSRQLEILKTYSLVTGESPNEKGRKKETAPEYHLTLKIDIRNLDAKSAHHVSYLLDGPSGLPMEGAWYASGRKTGPGWSSYGLRDLVLQLKDKAPLVIRCMNIAQDMQLPSDRVNLDYIGVDTQYFQCTMMPTMTKTAEDWLESYVPLRIGARVKDAPLYTNVSFRLKSQETELAPYQQSGDTLSHEYQIFAGPKQPALLKNYNLQDTIVYGWFWFVSIPLLAILHFFKTYLVFNYGLAILLLTVVVRLLMFPLSMKQITSSVKMQQLQPEINALKEKYADNPQEMMKAQQELWRKSGVNPLGGCLPMFIQLPIFIGLYKALSLDVNLYGVPLFGESIRWCSNLSAPDMMIDWSNFWNSIGWYGFNMGQGMFYLGPYFNLLPMLTIVLFLIQQKFMMPPVVGDDDAARQQRSMRRMMTFMMVFMGFMFFKVPSGLCLYFIASSLWGLLERRFYPKMETAAVDVESESTFRPKSSSKDSNAGNSRKNKRHREAPKEEKPKSRFRAWLEDIIEKAQEQQRLAKVESERQNNKSSKKKKK